jgi:hypothetical protein
MTDLLEGLAGIAGVLAFFKLCQHTRLFIAVVVALWAAVLVKVVAA